MILLDEIFDTSGLDSDVSKGFLTDHGGHVLRAEQIRSPDQGQVSARHPRNVATLGHVV